MTEKRTALFIHPKNEIEPFFEFSRLSIVVANFLLAIFAIVTVNSRNSDQSANYFRNIEASCVKNLWKPKPNGNQIKQLSTYCRK